MAGGSAILAIKIIADASGAIKEFDKVGKKTGAFAGGIGAAVPVAGTIVAGLGAMTAAAAKDQQEQAQLVKTYEKATGSTEDYSGAINAAIKAGQAKAFTDTDVRKGLAPLITATGDAEEANKMLGPAMDIARLAGVDLETASDAVAKSMEGQSRQLLALIPGMEKVKDPTEQLAIATALAAGSAETYAQSAPGQLLQVSDAYLELGESIGTSFLPMLKEMTRLLGEAAGFLRDHQNTVGPLAVLFGGLALAVLAVNVAMAALALLTSPVTLFILGLLAIGAGFVMLYQNSVDFRNIVDSVFAFVGEVIGTCEDAIKILGQVAQRVFDGVGLVVQSVFDVIKGIFDGALAWLQDPFVSFQEIGETVFAALETVVTTVIDAIKFIFTQILGFLRQPFEDFQAIAETVMGLVGGFAQTLFDGIKTLWDGLLAILKAPFEAFDDVVKTVMDTVTGLVEGAVGVIQGILDGISGAIKSVSDAVDAVNPFAVAPPTAGGGGAPSAMGLGRRTARSGGMGAGGSTIVNVNVASADPGEVMRAIRRWSRSNGGSGPFTRGLDRSTA